MAHPTGQERWIKCTEITYSAVARPSLTWIFLKGNTPCKTFILEVGKEMSFLNGWDTLDVDFYDTPGR